MPIEIETGLPSPLGASSTQNGVNFALYIQDQKPVQLAIYSPTDKKLLFKTEITQALGQIRHISLRGLPNSFIYKYICDDKELLDPYAKQLTFFSNEIPFDWGNDVRPKIKPEDLIIYEMHVRGFTQDPSSHVQSPGTYLGLIEKIGHLKSLGVNAVELLPIHAFNPHEYKILQYWGYSTVNFFSPMDWYAKENPVQEFKQMVRALHEAGIEVILDVVYNHTAEGGEKGPVINFKALGKETYYLLDENGNYANYSGCGNTFHCNHPVTIDLILTSLRYWVTEMHVDGFRFDLASVFYRGVEGFPPILDFITKDPVLKDVKLIAEPWDAAGLQHSGNFNRLSRWSEWNAHYRDGVRRFIIGTPGSKKEFGTRLAGSQDLYPEENPQKSLNFVTCHDGFTLRDLVSYNSKHNEANGEENRDGNPNNISWNCGVEGPTDDPAITSLRLRQMKNFHLALMLSQGIPMLHMGDEYGHTKKGNNNTWCQDNALNWFQWKELEQQKDFYQYYQKLIDFRNKTPPLKQNRFLSTEDIEWHGKKPHEPNWDTDENFIAFRLNNIYAAFNAQNQPVTVQFPEGAWSWVANSAKTETGKAPATYEMPPYSSLLLQAAVG